MNRTLGFFLGSAVVFVMLVLILGQPVPLAPPADRSADPQPGGQTITAPVRIPAPAIQRELPPAEPGEPAPEPETLRQTEPQAPTQQPVLAESVSPTGAAPAPVAGTVVTAQEDEYKLVEDWLASGPGAVPENGDDTGLTAVASAPQGIGLTDVAPAENGAGLKGQTVSANGDTLDGLAADPELAWFPLWDPFHSELSANAFARRLERVTGLDYRVIKTGTTEYRVAVGYTTEEQRLANLAAIEEATGLSIGGGSL